MSDSHATSGTGARESRPLSGQGLRFSLDRERREAATELAQASGGRTAKTLAKSGSLRVTLVVAAAGTSIEPEAAAGEATIQVLDGRIEFEVDDQSQQFTAGELAVLSQNLRQPIRVLEESAFLVTIAWPEGAGAWDQEQRQGRLQ
ncbi:MAG: cupin domain-containing protein [Chloroflexi bacterium]|nr:cupin domain-containing protein [Chloroflexota bacterium]